MTDSENAHRSARRSLSRRNFLKLGGGAALGLVTGGATYALSRGWDPAQLMAAPQAADQQMHIAVTDGFITLPGRPAPNDLYVFGFKEMPWDYTPQQAASLHKGKVQMTSPIIGVDQEDEFHLKVSNLGLQVRPDLDDAHTVHWHGFRNPIPVFDGVPRMSLAIPVGRSYTYVFIPHDPGTYIYHCHFEDVEHVQMAMIGIVYVRPEQNYTAEDDGLLQARLAGNTDPDAPMGYAYNDGDGSTAYDREFSILLTEIDERPHDLLATVQEFVWARYDPQYWTLNGRAYPDTMAPNGTSDPATGELTAPVGHPDLEFQPISSLIQANAGERVLLRLGHLGYQQHAMQLGGIPMRVVGHDATLMRGPDEDEADLTYWTNEVYLAPSVTRDVIFQAPAFDPSAPVETDRVGEYNVYYFKNRNYARLNNGGQPGPGGMMTEVRVYDGTLPQQEHGHQIFTGAGTAQGPERRTLT